MNINEVISSGVAMLTVEETAGLLNQRRTATYEAIRRNQIPSIRIGRRVFVPVPALVRLLSEGARPSGHSAEPTSHERTGPRGIR